MHRARCTHAPDTNSALTRLINGRSTLMSVLPVGLID